MTGVAARAVRIVETGGTCVRLAADPEASIVSAIIRRDANTAIKAAG